MLMRRRLYFVLPDVQSARTMLNDMLLARIECRHIHFLAARGTLPPDLPEASVLQKTDIVHGAQLGLIIGAVVGAAARIHELFEFALLLWSLVYVFLAMRRVYRASVLKTVLGLGVLAAAYVIFYALGISVAGMYAFLRA